MPLVPPGTLAAFGTAFGLNTRPTSSLYWTRCHRGPRSRRITRRSTSSKLKITDTIHRPAMSASRPMIVPPPLLRNGLPVAMSTGCPTRNFSFFLLRLTGTTSLGRRPTNATRSSISLRVWHSTAKTLGFHSNPVSLSFSRARIGFLPLSQLKLRARTTRTRYILLRGPDSAFSERLQDEQLAAYPRTAFCSRLTVR